MSFLKDFYQYYPRQVAFPVRPFRVTFNTEEDFFKYISENNMRKPKVFASLYNCSGTGEFKTCLIDKIGFDMDFNKYTNNDDLVVKKILDAHTRLMSYKPNSIKHIFKFSTGGIWLYVMTKNYFAIRNPKDCLRNVQKKITEILNWTIGEPELADVDYHIIGDIARVSRVWGSFDTERQLFVVPISIEDIKKGFGWLRTKAKEQCFEFVVYGEEEFDISPFDYIDNSINIEMPENIKEDYTLQKGTIIENFPPCIKRAIVSQDWKGWFLSTLYMKEVEGYTPKMTAEVMKTFLEKTCKATHKPWGNDFNHYRRHDLFPETVYRKDMDFPRCDKIYNEIWNQSADGKKKFCQGKCKFFMSFYKGDKEKDSVNIPDEVLVDNKEMK